MNLKTYFTSCAKINLKCVTDLNINVKTIIVLEENIGEKP